MNYSEKYENLYQFFGYFNQDWLHVYNWEERKPAYQPVVRKYKTESKRVGQTISELKEIMQIGKNFDYDSWVDVLTYDLGLAFRPKGFGLTHQEWLADVLKILEEPMEETRKHFIPKRIRE